MTPEQERFAELATRPLETSPDLREEARAEVFERLAHDAPDGSDDLANATTRLAAGKPSSFAKWLCLSAMAFVALGLIAGWHVRAALAELQVLQSLTGFGLSVRFEDLLRESLEGEARDFVFAGIGSDQEAAKNLQRQWELHPDEPGIYEELVHRRLSAKQGLPPGFAETWRRIEPDNGLWSYLEALGKFEEWKKVAPAGELFSREVLGLLRQSADAPRFESHLPGLRSRRLAMLGPSGTMAEETRLFLFSISALWVPTLSHQRDTLITYSKAAEQAVADKDPAGLAALVASWERLLGRLGRNQGSLLETIIVTSSWNQTGTVMLQASRDLGLHEEEVRLDDLKKQRTDFETAVRGSTPPARSMSTLVRLMTVGAWFDMANDEALYEPGRRAEYAVVERMLVLAASGITLLLFAGTAIEVLRRGRRVNGLADGLSPLFRPVDFLWIAGLGIVLPACWYFGITRWSPCGLRDIGLSEYEPRPILIQTVAALVFALLMTVQTARWRVTSRVGFLALKSSRAWMGWTMAGIAALVIPATGGVRWLTGNEGRYLQVVAATGGLSLLWLLWEAGSVIFSSRDQALRGLLLCRSMLAPLAILTALLLACRVPLDASERHWQSLDQISRVDRDHGGMSQLEARVMERVREHFQKAFPEGEGVR